MELHHIVGLAVAIATVAGFWYLLILQDKAFDKRFRNGDTSLKI